MGSDRSLLSSNRFVDLAPDDWEDHCWEQTWKDDLGRVRALRRAGWGVVVAMRLDLEYSDGRGGGGSEKEPRDTHNSGRSMNGNQQRGAA